MEETFIQEPVAVLAVLLGLLASLFWAASTAPGQRFFRIVPLLLFAYFLPTTLSSLGILPLRSPVYDLIKKILLPASLLLMTLSIDIPSILQLGRKVLLLFFGGTLSIALGGPLAYWALASYIPPSMDEQAWRGLAALSGSWIGGGANFVAIGESVGASDSMLGTMVVIDVLLANLWMAVLLFFAGHAKRLDSILAADRSSLEQLQMKMQSFQQKVSRASTLADLLILFFLAIGGTAIASWCGGHLSLWLEANLPGLGDILGPFAWTVILVTAIGITASFTPLRNLEGAGASRIGAMFLYLLVASIGAKAQFSQVLDTPVLLAVAAVWIAMHAVMMLLLQWVLKAPTFFMAVGSQANIGGAASAPIVASAFHPALAPVGALLGVAGYVVGTYAGLACAALLEMVHRWQ
ncbi:MAG: DUF819 family protein [Pirellulales bacterium]